MAMIKCPECGKEFSEYANICPNCGCPKETAIAIEANRLLISYEIKQAKCLYEVGESNLSSNDIVKINNIDYFVLQIIDDKAELISKNFYDVPYDGDHGYMSIFLDSDYEHSYIDKWMYNFYTNNLLPVFGLEVINTCLNYNQNGIIKQINRTVFALDINEALVHHDKFDWGTGTNFSDNSHSLCTGFWLASSRDYSYHGEQGPFAAIITCGGRLNEVPVNLSMIGARPAFWVKIYK